MGQIKFVAISIFILLTLSGCNDKMADKNEEYYQNGKLKSIIYYDELNRCIKSQEYFETGKLKQNTYFKKNLKGSVSFFYNKLGNLIAKKYWIDSINTIQYEYYKNKKIKSYGSLYNNKKNGWWKIYNKDGHLIQKDEIFTIEGKEVLNQRIKYDLKGQIIKSQSDIFLIELKDTLKIGRSIGLIKYKPKFSKDSKYSIYVGYNVNKDLSNLSKIKLDTFYSKNKDDIWFGVEFKTTGKKIIGGTLEEIFYETNKQKTDLIIKKNYKYFFKEIYVVK